MKKMYKLSRPDVFPKRGQACIATRGWSPFAGCPSPSPFSRSAGVEMHISPQWRMTTLPLMVVFWVLKPHGAGPVTRGALRAQAAAGVRVKSLQAGMAHHGTTWTTPMARCDGQPSPSQNKAPGSLYKNATATTRPDCTATTPRSRNAATNTRLKGG